LYPLLQLKPQVLLLQTGVEFATLLGHTLPHEPQLFTSLLVSAQ